MKYGTVDLDLSELLRPWFGDQAEVQRIQSLATDGKTVRAVVKAPEEALPGGADTGAGELPHYEAEFNQAVRVKFARQT